MRVHDYPGRPRASRKFEIVRLGGSGRCVQVQTYVTKGGQFIACFLNRRVGRDRFEDLVDVLRGIYETTRRYCWRPVISIEVSRGSTWDKSADGEGLYVRAIPLWLAEHEDGECPDERPTLYHSASVSDDGEIEDLAECHPSDDPLLGARRYQPADGERVIPWSGESWRVVQRVIETLGELRGRLSALLDHPGQLGEVFVAGLLGVGREEGGA